MPANRKPADHNPANVAPASDSPANCAILLTPPAPAAIAVIRITGDRVEKFLAANFSKPFSPMRCVHGELRDDARVIDDPVIVLHEDHQTADISLHGGPWVVQSCLDFLTQNGFAIVSLDSPLLFATDGGDQIEAEMLANLHLAHTELALTTLLAQPRAWRENPSVDVQDRALWWLLHPPTVAIVGIPNVGKSTLANQLFAQERSITANVPGTTRDWVGEIANIDGLAVTLIDTPGIRATDDPIERAAIDRAVHRTRDADLILIVLDVTRPLDEQRHLLDRHPQALRIANKCDLPARFDPAGFIEICAKNGANIDKVRSAIRAHFGCDSLDQTRARCWNVRQFQALSRGL